MPSSPVYRTASGRVLSDADIEMLASEAERGYPVERLSRRPGRPLLGKAPALLVPIRLHPDMHAAALNRAETELTSAPAVVSAPDHEPEVDEDECEDCLNHCDECGCMNESHYHCGNCGAVIGMMGHWDGAKFACAKP